MSRIPEILRTDRDRAKRLVALLETDSETALELLAQMAANWRETQEGPRK